MRNFTSNGFSSDASSYASSSASCVGKSIMACCDCVTVLPAGHEFTETPKIFWSLGKGRVGLKKDRISCSFLMFFNVFTAFQRCWVNSKTAPHVTSSGRNYVGRLNACEGICVGNSFPLPILSPNPMVHPVVQHDFHCCQFKDFKAVYGYALLSCLANAVGGCWRLVAVGEAAHFAAKIFIAMCFNGNYLCNMLQRSSRKILL
jgi:hypothetical protein